MSIDSESGCEIIKDSGFVLSGELIFGVTFCECIKYLTRIQVFPIAPSPTMTSLIPIGSYIIRREDLNDDCNDY